MRVIGLPEFRRCMNVAVRTGEDEEDLHEVIQDLADAHTSAEMRAASIGIEGTDIKLWATRQFSLSTGRYRITWRYEERSGEDAIVCFTLAEF